MKNEKPHIKLFRLYLIDGCEKYSKYLKIEKEWNFYEISIRYNKIKSKNTEKAKFFYGVFLCENLNENNKPVYANSSYVVKTGGEYGGTSTNQSIYI